MNDAIRTFEKVVSDFSESLRGVRNFNEDLSANIDRIQVAPGFSQVPWTGLPKPFTKNSVRIDKCAGTLESVSAEIQVGNHRLENMASVISQLRLSLDDSRKDREVFLKTVHDIPDKLLNYHEAAVASVDRKQVNP